MKLYSQFTKLILPFSVIISVSVLVLTFPPNKQEPRKENVTWIQDLLAMVKELKDNQNGSSTEVQTLRNEITMLRRDIKGLKSQMPSEHVEDEHLESMSAQAFIDSQKEFAYLKEWYTKIEKTVQDSARGFNLAKILKRLSKRSSLLDIGANIGAFTDYLAHTCRSCSIYSFEPVPEYADFIRHHYHRHPNVHVYSLCLGEKNENMTLWKDEKNLGWNTLIGSQANSKMRQMTVPVATLDQWSMQTGVNHFAFAKIDVEGAEYKVIRGMKKTIEAMYPLPVLLIEIGWGNKHPNWKEELAEFDWLFEHGYQRIELSGVSSTMDFLFLPKGFPRDD
jgi:FkbM family methyltransferase